MVCDNCFVKHRKCNREKPECSCCVKLDLECTWSHDKANKKKLGTVLMSLKPQKPTTAGQLGRFRYPGALKFVPAKKWEKPTVQTISSIIPIFVNPVVIGDWDSIFQKWMSKLDSKFAFETVMKCVGISLDFTSLKEKKFLATLFSKRIQPIPTHSKVPIQVCYDTEDLMNDINAAYLCYFQNINPFYPLFTVQQFVNKPRSHLLKKAICLVGLYFLPWTPQRDYLSDIYYQELSGMLVPSKLLIGLDTVQTILVYSIFITTKTEIGKTLGLCHMAGLMLKAMEYKNFHSDTCYELVLSNRFINKLECSFLVNFHNYLDYDTLSPSILRLSCTKEDGFMIIIGRFQFRSGSSYRMSLKETLSSLEKSITLIFTDSKSIINKIYKDNCAHFSSKDCYNVQYELKLIKSSVAKINTSYQESTVAINRLIDTTVTFYQKSAIIDLNCTHFRHELITRLNINSLLHDFKIFTCNLNNQVIELIPKHYYHMYRENYPELLDYIRKHGLLYAIHTLNLLSKQNINIFALQRVRCIFFASRIIMFHCRYLKNETKLDHQIFHCCNRMVALSKELIRPLSIQASNSYREKTFLELLDFFMSEYNAKKNKHKIY